MKSQLPPAPEGLQILESVKTGVLIIDGGYRLFFVNQIALDIVGRPWARSESDEHCFSFLFGRTAPCEDCLLRQEPTAGQQKSVSIRKADGTDVFLRMQVSPFGEWQVITLLDMTREVTLLRRIDLHRKEQQAKNVLLERRRQQVLQEQRRISALVDHLPEALLTVDGAFIIETRNRAVAEVLATDRGQKCYQLLGKNFPCQDCPAQTGFVQLDDVRKMHQLGDRYVTESISRSPEGDGGLLLFRDTTRQIQLIEKIRQQRQILTSLAELGTLMQKEADLASVVESFWDLFLPVVGRCNAVLLVNDIRPGTVWLVSRRGGCPEDALKGVTRAYLSREFQVQRTGKLTEEVLPWPETGQIVLRGRSGGLVGLLLLDGAVKDREEKELADLFVEPLGVCIENRLLSRKLEEKANTDPLTGLYNRGYLEQALAEEQEKLARFAIDFGVVVIDVNGLKKANDVYGHEAGDRLIIKVSELLRAAVRTTDILARTGGDEFVILLSDCTEEKMHLFVDRVNRDVFLDVFLEVDGGERFAVTVSLGGAATDMVPVDMLMREADRRMYEAKEIFYQNKERYR